MLLEGSTGDVYAVAVWDSFVVTAGYDMNIRIWNIATGKLLNTLYGHKHVVKSLVIWNNTDDQIIVSGSWDNSVRTWSLTTGRCLKELIGHTSRVKFVAVTQGIFPVVLSASDDRTIRLWEIDTGELIAMIDEPSSILSIAVTVGSKSYVPDVPDLDSKYSRLIMGVGGGEKSVHLWSNFGAEFKELIGHRQEVTALTFAHSTSSDKSPTYLLSACADGEIRFWDPYTGENLHTVACHTAWICGVSTVTMSGSSSNPSSRVFVLAVAIDGNVSVVDAESAELLLSVQKKLQREIHSFSNAQVLEDGVVEFPIVVCGREGYAEVLLVPYPTGNNQLELAAMQPPSAKPIAYPTRHMCDDVDVSTEMQKRKVIPQKTALAVLQLPVLTSRSRGLALEPKPRSPYAAQTSSYLPAIPHISPGSSTNNGTGAASTKRGGRPTVRDVLQAGAGAGSVGTGPQPIAVTGRHGRDTQSIYAILRQAGIEVLADSCVWMDDSGSGTRPDSGVRLLTSHQNTSSKGGSMKLRGMAQQHLLHRQSRLGGLRVPSGHWGR